MDHQDSLGNGIGGGEILDYFGGGTKIRFDLDYMNNQLMRIYHLMPYIVALIVILIIILMIRAIMSIYGIKTLGKDKGISSELEYIGRVKKNDASIIRKNKAIQKTTAFVESTIFRSNKTNKEYMDYNLERAGIKIPGGTRYLRYEEWNAMIVLIQGAIIALALVVTILVNYMLGAVMIVGTLVLGNTLPMIHIRQTVKARDDEINENFSDFYLMIHYVLLAGTKTPLVGIMKSYAKTTDSDEMKRMVDTCAHYIDTYGEYEGATYISKAYREVPLMGKLMRLIRQANEGGDIESELMGFRKELLDAKRYAIEKRTDKLIARARASFNLLLPILFQAILSAMSIYLSDMGMIQTFVT